MYIPVLTSHKRGRQSPAPPDANISTLPIDSLRNLITLIVPVCPLHGVFHVPSAELHQTIKLD